MQYLICPNCDNVSVSTATRCECCGYTFVFEATFYSVLGVEPNATAEEIKCAYRRKAAEWHPDQNKHRQREAHEMIVKINEAFTALKDPRSRKAYDDHLQFIRHGAGPASHGTKSGAGPAEASQQPQDSYSTSETRGLRFAFFPTGLWVGIRTILTRMAAWLLLPSAILLPIATLPLLAIVVYGLWSTGRLGGLA